MSEHAQPSETSESTKLERIATWLSLACAVHCLLVPILALVLPLAGASAGVLGSPALDRALLVLVLTAALPSALWGYRRHRDARALSAMLFGVATYLLGHA